MQAWFAAHWADIAIVLTLAWYGLDGWTRGFLALSLETVGFVLSLMAATLVYRPLGAAVSARFSTPPSFGSAIAFFGAWWLVDLCWPVFAGAILRKLPTRWREARIGRVFGVAPGLANGVLVLSVLLTVVTAFPLPASIKSSAVHAPLAQPIAAVVGGFDRLLSPVLGPLAQESVNLLTVHPESDERVALHFTVRDGAVDAASEQAMLALVNGERVKRGLKPLELDERLSEAARQHDRAMLAGGYFSHVDPDGATPADRLDAAGIDYATMGENLALAPDVAIAHDGLMNSPGHRANILSADFRKIGIGVIDAGVYGKMFAQEFTD